MTDERIEMLIRAVDSSLHQTTVLFTMLLNELYPPEPEPVRTEVDTTPREPQLIGNDDPILCQHPDCMEILDQWLCNSCGTNLSA